MRLSVLTAIVLCAVLLYVGGVVSAPSDPALVNGNFEGDFTPRGAGEVVVAVGWDPAWLEGDDRECRAPCYRPEYKPELQGSICRTGKCQRWFTTDARQYATIYQRVAAQQGQWYEFSCDVYNISETDGRMEVFVGINPWGADVRHRTMIWGQGYVYPYRSWTRLSVTAQAWGNQIAVAIGGNNDWATRNNSVYVDNCAIRAVAAPSGPTPTPYPTYTPYPTPAPCPTCAPGGECDYGAIRSIVREELDATTWQSSR